MNPGSPYDETESSTFGVAYPESPNRLWALPLVGGMVKLVIVLPIGIWLILVAFAAFLLCIVNGFVVLFNGTYWGPARMLALGAIRLSAKANCFVLGLQRYLSRLCPRLERRRAARDRAARAAQPLLCFAAGRRNCAPGNSRAGLYLPIRARSPGAVRVLVHLDPSAPPWQVS